MTNLKLGLIRWVKVEVLVINHLHTRNGLKAWNSTIGNKGKVFQKKISHLLPQEEPASLFRKCRNNITPISALIQLRIKVGLWNPASRIKILHWMNISLPYITKI